MKTEIRRAFTIVELLVVIAIIGVLVAMLLPAVGAARRVAELNTCRNNLRQLATATIAYETTFSRFPGYNEQLKGGGQPFPWPVALMPQLELQGTYDTIKDWALTSSSPEIPMATLNHIEHYVCPTDDGLYREPGGGDRPKQSGAGLSYVANAGRVDHDDAYSRDPRFRADGVFFNYWKSRTINSADTLRDGATNTLLYSENVSAGSWASLSGKKNSSGEMPNSIFVWHNLIPDETQSILWINGGLTPAQMPLSLETARPSSRHTGGVNGAFADGHVDFITADIEYPVYVQLMTSDTKGLTPDVRPEFLQTYALD